MDIRRLEAFCKVFELGSFSKAGQQLLLSQPTISAHVLSLEQELGTQLFDRLGRSILPTQAGTVLYGHAQQAFASLENARAEIALLQKQVAGELSIGGSTIPATYLLPNYIAGFTKRFPGVRVTLRVGDSQDIIALVQAGQLACGVVGAVAEEPELAFVPLREDHLLVAASPLMDLPRSSSGAFCLAPDELAHHPWVLREQGSGTRKAFETALNALGLDIRTLPVAVEARSHETVVQCARLGLGLCVVSGLAADPCISQGDMFPVEVEGLTMRRSFSVVRHVKRHVFPVLRFFLEYLDEVSKGGK